MLTVVLESLFTTDNQEITHKMSERIAFFLEENREKRRILFKRIKKIYKIRSNIVHGTDVSKIINDRSTELSEDLERIVQSVVKKVIINPQLCETFSGKHSKREEFFDKLIFS